MGKEDIFVALTVTFLTTTLALAYLHFVQKPKQTNKKRVDESDEAKIADDKCMSLFYSKKIMSDGVGLPYLKSCTASEVSELKLIHSDYRRLPSEFYSKAVECLPIV